MRNGIHAAAAYRLHWSDHESEQLEGMYLAVLTSPIYKTVFHFQNSRFFLSHLVSPHSKSFPTDANISSSLV